MEELLQASILPDANLFTTVIQAPELFRRWVPFGEQLLNGKLPARDRELLILRTGWNCRSEYAWGWHVPTGLLAGLSEEEIDRVASSSLEGWSPLDAALLSAADELHEDACIGKPTWTALSRAYDAEQLIEVLMLVGEYRLVAMTCNSLGMQLDEGFGGFPR